jgi:hypothetical protein
MDATTGSRAWFRLVVCFLLMLGSGLVLQSDSEALGIPMCEDLGDPYACGPPPPEPPPQTYHHNEDIRPPYATGLDHRFYYQNLTSTWAGPTTWAIDNAVAPTKINPSRVSAHDSADVAVLDNNYNQEKWVAVAGCMVHYENNRHICLHFHISYDNQDNGVSEVFKKHTACQEIGHTLGLGHDDSGGPYNTGCMNTGNTATYFDEHDKWHLDDIY